MAQAGNYTSYFKIVTPQTGATKMTDSQEMGDAGAYNNYTWYQRLIQGSASRMTRYREYDLMDNDIEVSRALDTIAEEMTGNNPKTKEPLKLDILTEDEDNVESTAVLTLKATLRRWGQMNNFPQRLYSTARLMVKYGDVFFKKGDKMGDTWQFVHPKNVIAAVVSEYDVTKVVAWQIKNDVTKPKSGGYSMPLGAKQDTQQETEIVPAGKIIRFSLNDDMSDTQPFGESILRAIYRSHKQKELLEDAVLIYRIQRAPERRVFYIDVGKMHPGRVKQYLENIKNEIKQKKIPTMNGGAQQVDSVYNPHSMCLALDTKIPLLDGRILTLQEMINEHEEGKQNWAYSINPKTGEVVPGIVSWAGVTRKNAETIKLILDNGEEIVCTPDHKFPIQGKEGKIEAKDITPEDSLYPFKVQSTLMNPKLKTTTEYEKVYNPQTKGWKYTHKIVAEYMLRLNEHNESVYDKKYEDCDKRTIHHKDYNSKNNNPDNLHWMNHKDHVMLHHFLVNNQEVVFSQELFDIFEKIIIPDIKTITFKGMLNRISTNEDFMDLYEAENPPQEGKKYKIKTDRIRQKLFFKFMRTFGYDNWMDYKQAKIQEHIGVEESIKSNHDEDDIKLLQYLLELVKTISIRNYGLLTYFKENIEPWKRFCELYKNVFDKTKNGKYEDRILSIPEHKVFERVAKYFNYDNFKHLVNESSNFNHHVVRIERGDVQDTGTLTIDADEKYHNYHTFATTSSFVFNSEDFYFAQRPDGHGSRVETLPGGQGLGELSDLEYFQQKIWRGLKIPVSYMQEQGEGGSIWNDGKVGIAYIQELRFSLYIERLQAYMENVLDAEFKDFLRQCNIRIDESMYRIMLPEPSNFGKYRQLELDSQLLSSYTTADGIPYFSPRFTMKRYLQMSDEEIITNERLRREELGIDPDSQDPEDLKLLYGGEEANAMGGGMGAGGGFGGAELGMNGEPTGEPSPEEMSGGTGGPPPDAGKSP